MSGSFRDFWCGARSRAGNVALMFALATPLVVGAAALGIETTYWAFKSLRLQDIADAAAHAGALEQRSGGSGVDITSIAQATAQDNGLDLTRSQIEVFAPPVTGPKAGNTKAVEVLVKSPTPRFLSALFLDHDLVLTGRSVATFNDAASACILALNKTTSKAALFSGSTNTTFTGCSVMANSTAADAVVTQGSSTLSTDCLISGGGVQTNSYVTMSKCPTPITQAPPAADPFKNLPTPTAPGGCQPTSGSTLLPGNYCGGLTLKGSVNLSPGVYILSGDLQVNANANITGTGVTIYLASGAHVSMNGNATVRLSAPTSGTYSGILLWGDRNGVGGKSIVNGTAASQLTGAIYFAKDEVDYLGNFSGTNGCTQVVADTIQWSGSTNIAADCTSLGMTPIPALALVRLTE